MATLKVGIYTVRMGYKILRTRLNNPTEEGDKKLWRIIWKSKGIIPRVRMFLWRACRKALPTAFQMHRRILALI
jgi:zinc-binding in reverse transcriptase